MRCYRKILLIQRSCYQRESPYRDPACNRTTGRPRTGHRKDTQTEVAGTCLRSRSPGPAKTILHGTVKGGGGAGREKTRQTAEEMGRQRKGVHRPGANFQRAVKNRGKWRKLVEKSSAMPEPPRGYRIGEGEGLACALSPLEPRIRLLQATTDRKSIHRPRWTDEESVGERNKLTAHTTMTQYNSCVPTTLLYGSQSWTLYSRQGKIERLKHSTSEACDAV